MAQLSQDDSCEHGVSKGLTSVVSLATCLAQDRTDPEEHETVKGHCRDALEAMKSAEKALEAHTSALSAQIGEGLVRTKELADEQKQKETKLSQLKIQMENCEQMHFLIQDKVTMAENHLQELTTLLRKARRKEKCFNTLSNITLVFLPLYGLVVSMKFFQEALQVTDTQPLSLSAGIVAIICHVSLWVAQKARLELQKAIEQYQGQVSNYKKEGYECNREKADVKEKTEDITAEQEAIKEAINELGKLLKALQEEKRELEKHVPFVRMLTEKINTLELYVEDPSDYEFATIVLEEINQLVLSALGKGGQRGLGFSDKETIKKAAEELNRVAQKIREGNVRKF